jgi:hypothetical protein
MLLRVCLAAKGPPVAMKHSDIEPQEQKPVFEYHPFLDGTGSHVGCLGILHIQSGISFEHNHSSGRSQA